MRSRPIGILQQYISGFSVSDEEEVTTSISVFRKVGIRAVRVPLYL